MLEMKEWPDAITMFSREENALEASMKKRKRRSNYCELCEDRFFLFENSFNLVRNTSKTLGTLQNGGLWTL